MSNLTDALHDFVQASNDYREASNAGSLNEERCEKALAQAGDRYDAALLGFLTSELTTNNHLQFILRSAVSHE